MNIDPDEGPRVVLARMDALRADPPPAPPTLEGLVAALGSRWRLDIPVSVHDFPKRFGKRVKAAGGHYSECRGSCQIRFVNLPGTAAALADEMIAEACEPYTARDGSTKRRRVIVVAEGGTTPFDFGNSHSWVTVHRIRSMAEAITALTSAVTEALARDLVRRRNY